MKDLTEQDLLEIEGTDPYYVLDTYRNTSDSDLARVIANASDSALARLIANAPDSDLARLIANAPDSALARLIANASDSALARLIANAPDSDLARVIANASDSALARLITNVPEIKSPYSAILSAISAEGCSLDMGNWHTCKTTHCLAGWTVVLAGVAGVALEKKCTTPGAAALILRKSRPDAPLPNFYARTEAALAFIRARAREEK